MEADWAAEIGPGLPSIDVPWEGYVDLRENLSVIDAIPEAALCPALSSVLCVLNSKDSPVFTSKCDRWILDDEAIDHNEFAAPASEAQIAVACYIDILQRDPIRLASFEFHENWVRRLTASLRNIPVTHSRVDLVLRQAMDDQSTGFGVTLYIAGCGADASAAEIAWQAALTAAIPATIKPEELRKHGRVAQLDRAPTF